MRKPRIVVLTPVKNEAWILDRFLAACAHFADAIVVLDQQSVDQSREICRKHAKCVLLDNPDGTYDEAHRQRVLITAARERFEGPRILLALDADEVIAADSIGSEAWGRCMTAEPGTGIFFEKPDILDSSLGCWRYPGLFLLGFVDDGAEHYGKTLHSARLPFRYGAPRLDVPEIAVMHFARARGYEYRHRQCFYSMLERLRQLNRLRGRWVSYSPRMVWPGRFPPISDIPAKWTDGWRRRGIDFTNISSCELNYWTIRVIEMFALHGQRMFWFEDIWDVDWERLRKEAIAAGMLTLTESAITRPPRVVGAIRTIAIRTLANSYGLRFRLLKRRA